MNALLYVSCSATCEIAVLGFDADDGTTQELFRTRVPTDGEQEPGSMPLAQSPDGHFLYVCLRTPPVRLHSYAIDPNNGALTWLGSGGLPYRAACMAIDPAQRHLFTVSYPGHVLTVSPIERGVVGDAVQVLAPPAHPHGVLFHPGNGLVYVASMGGNVVLAYRFDRQRGVLEDEAASSVSCRPGAGPKLLVLDRGGGHLYALGEYDAVVYCYEVDPVSGGLRQMQCVSMLPEDVVQPGRPLPAPRPGVGTGDIHLSPDERFLYASDRPTNSLAVFRVAPETGMLTPVQSVAGEPIPRGFAMEPAGRFLFCGGLETGRVVTYRVEHETGMLHRASALQIGATVDAIEPVRVAFQWAGADRRVRPGSAPGP